MNRSTCAERGAGHVNDFDDGTTCMVQGYIMTFTMPNGEVKEFVRSEIDKVWP